MSESGLMIEESTSRDVNGTSEYSSSLIQEVEIKMNVQSVALFKAREYFLHIKIVLEENVFSINMTALNKSIKIRMVKRID